MLMYVPCIEQEKKLFMLISLIVNHHLLMADLAMKEESISSLLPSADVVIVDEAHQISSVARHFFGETVTSGQLMELSRDVRRELQLLGNDHPELRRSAMGYEDSVNGLSRVFSMNAAIDLEELLTMVEVQDAIDEMDLSFSTLAELLEASAIRSKVLQQCYQRCLRLMDRFAVLTERGRTRQCVCSLD